MGGLGIAEAYEKALHYFTLSAHQGHTLALYNLGQMHLNGLGVSESCPVAVQFLKAVAERGSLSSMFEDAHAALQRGDVATPLQLYSALAEGGYEVAQSNLAFLLDEHYVQQPGTPLLGLEGGAIATRAMQVYRKAAHQGNVDAELRLGDYHYYGYGTPVDLDAAVTHYRVAAEVRSPQAMFNLAYMYARGLGLSRDFHLAKRHYDMAAETAEEARVPVQIALLQLRFLKWRESRRGTGSYPLLRDLASSTGGGSFDWDTVLIITLLAALALVVRQRVQLQRLRL